MTTLAGLAVFAGLSLNMMLQFALGLGESTEEKKNPGSFPVQSLILFLSVFILWAVSEYILGVFRGGFLEYFLLFPLSALLCVALELGAERLCPRLMGGQRAFHARTAYDGLAPVSLLLTLYLASSFGEALVLSFFFALGTLCVLFILLEIRRRAALERVPLFLKRIPLQLISMGLLSLIFSSVAGIFFKILKFD